MQDSWGFGPGGAGNTGPMTALTSANAKLGINASGNDTIQFNNKATRIGVRINETIALQKNEISAEAARQFIESANPVQFVIANPELPEEFTEYYEQYLAWLNQEDSEFEENTASFQGYLLELEETTTGEALEQLRSYVLTLSTDPIFLTIKLNLKSTTVSLQKNCKRLIPT